MKTRGTLNFGLRMEWLMARAALQMAQANSKNPQNIHMRDFLRFHDKPVEKKEMTGADLAKMYGAVMRKPNG